MDHTTEPKPTPRPETKPEAPPIEVNPGEVNTRPEVEYGQEPVFPEGPVPERPFEPQPVPEREVPNFPEIEPAP